ncbi:MAG: hypothetical protein ACI90V_013403, partial [Bacillariaceae sp.]
FLTISGPLVKKKKKKKKKKTTSYILRYNVIHNSRIPITTSRHLTTHRHSTFNSTSNKTSAMAIRDSVTLKGRTAISHFVHYYLTLLT